MPDPSPRSLSSARARAILLVVASGATFAIASASVKAVGPDIPLWQIVLFRNLIGFLALVPVLAAAGGLRVLRTRHPFGHAQRIFWGLIGMVAVFYGYIHLPLATVTALGFTMPLFLTGLAMLLLKEKVGWRRRTAVGVGFLGVLAMAQPQAGEETDLVAVGLVLFGAFAWAMAMLSIKALGDKGEPAVAIVAWFALGSAGIALVMAMPVWVTPNWWQLALLVTIGVVSAAAQLMMTEAYRTGETTLIAPFEYSQIIWTAALGALIWYEMPDAWDALGISLLVGAGLYIWHREVRLGVRR
jgi:drug/metabolite transporter (DMT)-like permease